MDFKKFDFLPVLPVFKDLFVKMDLAKMMTFCMQAYLN